MKKTIFALFTIVALVSCGTKSTETKSDSIVEVDSTIVDSLIKYLIDIFLFTMEFEVN